MKCRSCGKEIVWIKMYGSGKKMPVDAEPVDILLYGSGFVGESQKTFIRSDGVTIHGREIGDAWDDDPDANVVKAYRSHFATCPYADKHRQRGRAS